jgi:hypothetical protein
MTKKYNSPMLHVVSINKNDIIVTSPGYGGYTTETSGNLGADRFRDFEDYSY